MKYRIEIRKGKAGWFWRLVHKNRRTLAHSEVYSSKRKAMQTAKPLAAALECEIT